MDQSFYTQFDELPLTLCATDIRIKTASSLPIWIPLI